jgi:hypothetical protein
MGWCDGKERPAERERNGGGGARCRARGGTEKRSLTAQSVVGQIAEA